MPLALDGLKPEEFRQIRRHGSRPSEAAIEAHHRTRHKKHGKLN